MGRIAIALLGMVTIASAGTRPGEVHPDFHLPQVDGGSGRLSGYRGKKLLLIHFASW
jgi:peroxiredoxin